MNWIDAALNILREELYSRRIVSFFEFHFSRSRMVVIAFARTDTQLMHHVHGLPVS